MFLYEKNLDIQLKARICDDCTLYEAKVKNAFGSIFITRSQNIDDILSDIKLKINEL